MKKIIMILFFLVSVCFLNNFSASAAETGIKEATEIDTDIFEIEGLPGITFNILPGRKIQV